MGRIAIVFAVGVVAIGCASGSAVQGESHVPPRLAPLESILESANHFSCVEGLRPIPATVIDVGVFKNVPYQSFSNGRVEVNAYGDPLDLVGLEAGTVHQDPTLQSCLIGFTAAQALLEGDRVRIAQFTPQPFVEELSGLTVETTPPTAEDAYGSWWISLERRARISGAVASEAELRQVSTTAGGWVAPPLVSGSAAPLNTSTAYSPPPYTSYRPSSGGRVFVHGYTRKNGTYVQSHSRRR